MKFIAFFLSLLMLFPCAFGDEDLQPGNADLSLSQAAQLGKTALQQQFDFQDDMMARFSLSAQLWEGSADDFTNAGKGNLRVWSISFRYAGETEGFLDEMTLDLHYSIHVDAQSGRILSSRWDDPVLFQERMDLYLALAANHDYTARRQEACSLSLEYLMDETGMTEEEAALLSPRILLLSDEWEIPSLPVDYENAWWRVSFSLPGLDELPALILAVEAESGYTYLDAGNEQDFAQAFLGYLAWQQQWSRAQEGALALSQQWGDPLFWTYEQKAGFYQEYGMAPDLTGEGAETSCDLPEKTDTPYEAALQAAKAALRLHLQAEETELETLKISAHFTNQFWHPAGDRAWIFHFYAPHATSRQPDSRYAAFVVSPAGDAVTVMSTAPDAGDQDYWSILEE